jgi:2-haloacid dehalogenase
MRLSDYKALTFDCYGTLIDWESGMVAGLKLLIDKVERETGRELSRDEVLQAHARHESSQQKQTPAMRYYDLLAIVYKRLSEEWGVSFSQQDAVNYGQSVKHWPAFPDSIEALNYLKQHFKLVILSNVDNESFTGSNARLGVEFDAIYTAEDCGSYKPDGRNFDYMLDKLKSISLEKGDILHTAESMFHDHGPANRFGLANCWIYRRHDKQGFGATMNPGELPKYDFRFTSMGEMVRAHQAELEG